MEFRGYYGKHKREKQTVLQTNVGQSIKTSIRFTGRNYKKIMDKVNYINSLDPNMQTDFSKTLNTILDDCFLDEELEQQKFELSDIN